MLTDTQGNGSPLLVVYSIGKVKLLIQVPLNSIQIECNCYETETDRINKIRIKPNPWS